MALPYELPVQDLLGRSFDLENYPISRTSACPTALLRSRLSQPSLQSFLLQLARMDGQTPASTSRIFRTNIRSYCLEGHRDLVSGLIMGIAGVIIWLIGVLNLLTKSP